MRVWIVRHGESQTNKEGKWTGQLDVELTDKGRAQAIRVGERLVGVSFDKIYSSDLVRARTTAELATSSCEYEIRSDLREIDVGSIAGGRFEDVSEEVRTAVLKSGYGVIGGEERDAFRTRVLSFMKMLEGEYCQNIAVFTHAGWLRQFLSLVVCEDIPRASFFCGNCATAVFEYENGRWRVHSWMNLL